MPDSNGRWNLNIWYHKVFLRAASPGGGTALDIGCGDGLLSFDLAATGMTVVGIDVHAPSIERAQSDRFANDRASFVCDDFFTHRFPRASFDLVAANAMLHHVDAQAGLRRMRQLVRPGGAIAVVGFALPSGLPDHMLAVAGAVLKRSQQIRGKYWEHNAPISWPPPLTIDEMADLGSSELPGSVFRRLMSNRYSLTWSAPADV